MSERPINITKKTSKNWCSLSYEVVANDTFLSGLTNNLRYQCGPAKERWTQLEREAQEVQIDSFWVKSAERYNSLGTKWSSRRLWYA